MAQTVLLILFMEQIRLPKPHSILNKAFLRKKEKNSAYSQRSLARDLGVSAPFVTKLLTGKSSLPVERVKRICKVLDIDLALESLLMQSLVYHSFDSSELRAIAMKGMTENAISRVGDYNQVTVKKFSILRDWYNLPILDLLTCEGEFTPQVIAKRIGLTLAQVQKSLTAMKEAGLASDETGTWKKTEQRNYFPSTKSLTEIREYHKQMIKIAHQQLSETSQEAFDARLITAFTMAVNPEHIETAKKEIFDFLTQLSHRLSEGSCTSVYQCNLQLFPLTKK